MRGRFKENDAVVWLKRRITHTHTHQKKGKEREKGRKNETNFLCENNGVNFSEACE